MKNIKLNLGSGPNGIEGWINYDWGMLPLLSKFPWLRKMLVKFNLLPKNYDVEWPRIELFNIKEKLPLNNKSVGYIYCSHVLEHFEKYQTEKILMECNRVLKKGGIIRIVVPDIKKMIKNYSGADEFCREFYGYDKDKEYGLMGYFIRGHQWMYDEKSLINMFKKQGYADIKVCKFREGRCPDIERLDYEGHRKISVYVEASSN